MAKVRYELIADPGISITKLVFEYAVYANINKTKGELDIEITDQLDVDFACEGNNDAPVGSHWQLFIWVNNRPIKTKNLTGSIEGQLDNRKAGTYTGGFNW